MNRIASSFLPSYLCLCLSFDLFANECVSVSAFSMNKATTTNDTVVVVVVVVVSLSLSQPTAQTLQSRSLTTPLAAVLRFAVPCLSCAAVSLAVPRHTVGNGRSSSRAVLRSLRKPFRRVCPMHVVLKDPSGCWSLPKTPRTPKQKRQQHDENDTHRQRRI